MKVKMVTSLFFFLCVSIYSFSQATLAGTWKGTSLCQVKGSPCQSENVVYYIAPSDSKTEYEILMKKIVKGTEEDMGTIKFTYDPANRTLVSRDETRNTEWKLKVYGNKLEGTLLYNNSLYRVIKVVKEPDSSN